MRLLSRDPVTGLHRLRLETPSDLWRISRLVRPGDIVGASTTRRDPEAPADVPGAERTRRWVYLVIRTEQVEFHGFSGHVRLTGPIVEGPFDIGRHHTLDLAEGDDVAILKPTLGAGDRALLDEGLSGKGEPTIVIASVDWGTPRSSGSGDGRSNRSPMYGGPSPGSRTGTGPWSEPGRCTLTTSSRSWSEKESL